ncbi:MAG: hypothetical protein U0930_20955 [Pirellulales bacterium]
MLKFEIRTQPANISDAEEYGRQLLASNSSDAVDAVMIVKPELQQRALGNRSYDSLHVAEAKYSNDSTNGDAANESSDKVNSSISNEVPTLNSSKDQGIVLLANMARDQSMMAHARLSRLVDRWWDNWRTNEMIDAGLSQLYLNRFSCKCSTHQLAPSGKLYGGARCCHL